MQGWVRLVLASLAIALLSPRIVVAEAPDYVRDIEPIFLKNCNDCHGVDVSQQDLRLDSFVGLKRGGNSGTVIVAGKSAESLLMDAITVGKEAAKMPPEDYGDRLSAADVDLIRRWIDAGAVGPENAVEKPKAVKSEHWAFQPIANVVPPRVKDAAWCRTPIDRFVLAKLEEAGLPPSPEADRPTQIRRLSLDLVGMPPSVEAVDEYVHDAAPDAYEQLVDRVLASPHYGERWGRHWLDQARYADSNGYTIDSARSMWNYRDWVITAVNNDEPFDQFSIEQLAGDMLPNPTREQLIATGFHRNTLVNEEGGTDPEQFRVEAVVDRVSTTGSVFLGLTVGCARCHDHKYDPVSQREFYQMFAVFNGADEPSLELPTDQQAGEEAPLDSDIATVKKRLADVEANAPGRQKDWEKRFRKELDELEKSGTYPASAAVLARWKVLLDIPLDKRSPAQTKELQDEYFKHDLERIPLVLQLDGLNARKKQLAAKITTALIMRERAEPRGTFVHMRGDFLRPGAPVAGGTPAVLPPAKASGARMTRLDFARWLFEPEHPLTSRVTVNRVWQTLFGRGLVATENDFGLQGDSPSHPELLDWLSRTLQSEGWSLKALHRLIVTSAAYRQSSAARADLAEKDPYNNLVGRQIRLRLEAEVIRDSALASSGLLIDRLGGPGVYPPQPEGIYKFTQNVKFWKQRTPEDNYRRGVYTFFWRSSPYPFLMTFDAPDSNVSCTRRTRSNTPLQSLTLANDAGFVDLANGLAKRVLKEASADETARIDYAFRLCFCRSPSADEQARLRKFVESERKRLAENTPAGELDLAVWAGTARVLLNLDEFVTRE
jgi:mono/diheme cytochrome c family protein